MLLVSTVWILTTMCGRVDVSLCAVTVSGWLCGCEFVCNLVNGCVDVSLCVVSMWLCGCEFVCCYWLAV